MAAKMTGVMYSHPTHVLYVGPLIASARHRHHAGQVFWAPEGIDVEDEHGAHRRVVTHLVPPHESHSHAAVPMAAVLWVDRDELQGVRAPGVKAQPFCAPTGVRA